MKFKKYNNNKEQTMLHKKNIYSLLLYTLLMSSSHVIALPDFLYFGKISKFIWNKIPTFSPSSSFSFGGWWLTKKEAQDEFYNFNQRSHKYWNNIQNEMNERNKKETEDNKKVFEGLNNESKQQFTAQNKQLVNLQENLSLLNTTIKSNDAHIIKLNEQTSLLNETQKITNNNLKTLNQKTKKTTIFLQKNDFANKNFKKDFFNLKNEYDCLKNNFDKILMAHEILQKKFNIAIKEHEKKRQHCDLLIKDNLIKDDYIESLKRYIQQNGANSNTINKSIKSTIHKNANFPNIKLGTFNLKISHQNLIN